MKRWWLVAGAVVLMPASAQAMTVEEFLIKARALKAKGPLALFSSDLAPVKAEIKAVATSYRADLRADKAAGRAPHSCPPPEGSQAAKMKPDAFLAELEKIPLQHHRSMSMKTAFYLIMKRRWPCPA